MPRRPKTICTYPGCNRLCERGRCDEHRHADRRQYDARRPSAARRGYGRRWQRYRRWYLARNPICITPGCGRPSEDVDHIVPVSGPEDPLFWDATNHQALCHSCHSSKTAAQDGGFGRRGEPPEGGRGVIF